MNGSQEHPAKHKECAQMNPTTMREIFCGNSNIFKQTLKEIEASLSLSLCQSKPYLFVVVGQPLTGKTTLQAHLLQKYELNPFSESEEQGVVAFQLLIDQSRWDKNGNLTDSFVQDIKKVIMQAIRNSQLTHLLLVFSSDINIHYPGVAQMINNTVEAIKRIKNESVPKSNLPISLLVTLTAQPYDAIQPPFYVEEPTTYKLQTIKNVIKAKQLKVFQLPIDLDAMALGLWQLVNSDLFNQHNFEKELKRYFGLRYYSELVGLLMKIKNQGINQDQAVSQIKQKLEEIKDRFLQALDDTPRR